MTTDNKTKPAFYLFSKGENGENNRVGAAFRHKKGNGLNIVIDGKYYSAFPPKEQSATATEGESA